jgi:ubiquinone/menaquinone biosynthesis C-methylase UbiE
MNNKKETSWGGVADWYKDHVVKEDSYHNTVVLPNLLRMMDIAKEDMVLDLACGSGFFAFEYAQKAQKVLGVDISSELISHARSAYSKQKNLEFFASPAHKLPMITGGSISKISIVLALQNIKEVSETLAECSRVLQKNSSLFIVINHPAFRIPKGSSWQFDEKENKQFRRIDYYLSEKTIEIDMHPGQKNKETTVSFHRSLQFYMKVLTKNGFCITKLEEWISPKKSEPGPRQSEEDRTRKEIPLFMCLEVKKI